MYQDLINVGICIFAAMLCACLYIRYIIWSANRKISRSMHQIFPTQRVQPVEAVQVVLFDESLPVATEVTMVNPPL